MVIPYVIEKTSCQFLIGTVNFGKTADFIAKYFKHQFLIGTVNILSHAALYIALAPKYQFLIGTVNPMWFLQTITDNKEYQFLIGTVNTPVEMEALVPGYVCINSL